MRKSSKEDEEPPEPPPADAPYDPHLYRERKSPTTNLETLIHLLKGSLGTGIMAMPKAFDRAGLAVGFVFTLLIGALCTYCMHVLVKNQYVICKKKKVPVLTYPESMEAALEEGPNWMKPCAKPSKWIVDFFLVIYQLGICCVYIVFISDTIKKVCDQYTTHIDGRLYMLMILPLLVVINYIPDLKRLAPLSGVANAITFVGLGIIMYFIFRRPLHPDTLPLYGEFLGFPLFVGTTLFALEAVGVVIALEANMKTPKSFGGTCGVLNVGMTVITFLYVFMGFFGYLSYGKESKDSITLNLERGGLSDAVQIIMAIAIIITYALQAYVPVDILWNTYLKKKSDKHPTIYEYLLRTGLVLLTFVVAVGVPHLGDIISLFGAFCLSALGIAFPAIIEICVHHPDNYGIFKWILVKDILLILIGIFALVSGTYSAILEIVRK